VAVRSWARPGERPERPPGRWLVAAPPARASTPRARARGDLPGKTGIPAGRVPSLRREIILPERAAVLPARARVGSVGRVALPSRATFGFAGRVMLPGRACAPPPPRDRPSTA